MRNGLIKLVSPADEVLKTRQYWGISHREEIIEYWRKQYGKRFNDCYIHLLPNVNAIAVRENGKNMRFKKDKPTIYNGYDPTKKFGTKHKTKQSFVSGVEYDASNR